MARKFSPSRGNGCESRTGGVVTTPLSRAIMANVSSTTAAPSAPQVNVNRPNTVSVGTIVWLSSELMFFAGLFAMYFTHRSVSADIWPEH